MIKTIDLTADTEQEVQISGGNHVKVWNRTASMIYISKKSPVTADSDGVKAIESNCEGVLRNVGDTTGKFYIKAVSSGKVEIETAIAMNDFFKSSNNTGGGGSGDTYTKSQIDDLLNDKEPELFGSTLILK